MVGKGSFIHLLREKGYEVVENKLGGGLVNDVKIITAHKIGEIIEYVLKIYGSEKDARDALRGYNLISSIVKTPKIVYNSGKEIVYELVKGKNIKDMISEKDPEVFEAIKLLAKELEKLHNSKSAPPRYRRGDSPDEKKMIKHILKALELEQITSEEANKLFRQIKSYIPKNKSIIHGDAHLGNFIYSKGTLYFIDPDNVKISDYNADIGKVVHAIERFGEEGKISESQVSELRELFLAEYNGEDMDALNIYRVRTPLIELKSRTLDIARKAIRLTISKESRFVIASLIIISSIFLIIQNNLTGSAILNGNGAGSFLFVIFIIFIGIFYYFYVKMNKLKVKVRM